MRFTILFLLALLPLASCGGDSGTAPEDAEAKAAAGRLARQAEHYPIETCLVSGDALGETPSEANIENHLVRTCSEACLDQVRSSPEEWLSQLDEAARVAQLPTYPTDICPISESKIDSMGGPLDVIIEGRLVRFCCEGCVVPFERKADEYFAAMDAAATDSAGQ